MPPEPGSPADWLEFARSDLELAKVRVRPEVRLESLCFHAQQAAEKSLKAVLLARRVPFPRTHNLSALVDLLPASVDAPPGVEEAVRLSDYAVTARYPGGQEPVEVAEYDEAVRLAQAVVEWAEGLLGDSTC